MIIRRAMVTDLFEASRLWQSMLWESDPDMKPNLPMWREYVVGLMKYPGYFMFVAEEADHLVGVVDYAMQPEPGKGIWLATVNYFYVHPNYRKEVSGQLWQTVIKSAKDSGAKEFSAICFPDKLGFWERHGFEKQYHGIRKEL